MRAWSFCLFFRSISPTIDSTLIMSSLPLSVSSSSAFLSFFYRYSFLSLNSNSSLNTSPCTGLPSVTFCFLYTLLGQNINLRNFQKQHMQQMATRRATRPAAPRATYILVSPSSPEKYASIIRSFRLSYFIPET